MKISNIITMCLFGSIGLWLLGFALSPSTANFLSLKLIVLLLIINLILSSKKLASYVRKRGGVPE